MIQACLRSVHPRGFFGVILCATLALLGSGCGDDAGSDGDTGSGFVACDSDADCAAGQGCDTEGGSLSPGYCTPLCSTDSTCPTGYSCPAGVKDQPGECDAIGEHGSGRGICDQFSGAHGPDSCGLDTPAGEVRSDFVACDSDADCAAGQGCDTESGRLSPGYCTPLCSTDSTCPGGYSCPAGVRDQPGECDAIGDHGLGRGICDQFDGVNGPATCGQSDTDGPVPGGGPNNDPATCTQSGTECKNGMLTTCDGDFASTVRCEDHCAAIGFEPGSECSTEVAGVCACGDIANSECAKGVGATCTCLDTAQACQDDAVLALYSRCHSDPTSEEAELVKCFGGYLVGDMVACNDAILACGDSGPDVSCTADVDCGRCERCERSTGNCLTKVGCR